MASRPIAMQGARLRERSRHRRSWRISRRAGTFRRREYGRDSRKVLTILFDGVAYGMLLFVLACGLSVTLGLMNFINLAHGAFAMAGGYCTVVLVNRMGVPFWLGLPLAFLATALLGGLFERTLYVHVYARPHLDQVLFTIGLVFMSVAATDYVMGSSEQFVQIPESLQGQFNAFGVGPT